MCFTAVTWQNNYFSENLLTSTCNRELLPKIISKMNQFHSDKTIGKKRRSKYFERKTKFLGMKVYIERKIQNICINISSI